MTVVLRVRDIVALPADITQSDVVALIGDNYEVFSAAVVAEATRRGVPPALRHVLQQDEWHDDWIDALTGAEANIQVAVLRARYEEGPDSSRTRNNTKALAGIRTRLRQLRTQARHQRRDGQHEHGSQAPAAVRTATRKLISAHSSEYQDVLAEALVAAGISLPNHGNTNVPTTDRANWAIQTGIDIVPQVTDRVTTLQEMTDAAFQQVVAADAQRQPPEPELGHPLLLHRWGQCLAELAQQIANLLDLPEPVAGGVADAYFTVAGLDGDDAYLRINRLKFMAHVHQRWLEQKTLSRRLLRRMAAWEQNNIEPVRESARQQMRDTYPHEYQMLLDMPLEPAAESPPPTAVIRTPASSTPDAARVFAETVTRAGWTAKICSHGATDRLQVRVEAARGDARLRVAFKRGNNRAGKGWKLRFVGVCIPGTLWIRLPKVSDAIDLAMMPTAEFNLRVIQYRDIERKPHHHRPTTPPCQGPVGSVT